MPKQILKLEQFSGGINDNSDARDIQLTEFASLTNMTFSNQGKLTVLGEFTLHESTPDDATTHKSDRGTGISGYGLFSFDHDYTMLDGTAGALQAASAITETPCNFFALYHDDDSGAAEFTIFQKNASALDWTANASERALGGTGGNLSYFISDGALRVSAGGIDGSNNSNKWLGLVAKKHMLKDTQSTRDYAGNPDGAVKETTGISEVYNTGSAYNNWGFENTNLGLDKYSTGPWTPVANGDGDRVALNAIAVHTGSLFGEVFHGTGFDQVDSGSGDYIEKTSSPLFDDWGIAVNDVLTIYEHDTASVIVATNKTVTAVTSTRLTFAAGALAGDLTASGSGAREFTFVRTNCQNSKELGGFGFADEYIDIGSTHDGVGAGIGGESNMRWGVGLYMASGANGSGTWMPTTGTRYKFYITTMYDNHTQESKPILMAMYGPDGLTGSAQNFTGAKATSEVYFCNDTTYGTPGEDVAVHLKPVIKMNGAEWHTDTNSTSNAFGSSAAADTSGGNPRITGVRIYYSSTADGHSDLWQLFDCNFLKGTKAFGMTATGGDTGYAPWQSISLFPSSDYTTVTTSGHYAVPDWDSGNKFSHPPTLVNYFTNNFHSHDEEINVNSFKTAVVANRRAYIGNVNQNVDGNAVQFSDRMLKSPVGQFDKFPASNYIDVAINDGSQIIHLATFGDRLLQFKERVLYIINIAEDSEYLESSHPFKGVTNPGSVCVTDEGVAWANEDGAYFYDGQRVSNLLESQGTDIISPSTWQSCTGVPLVGYIRDKKQIIFIDSSDATGTGNVFIFHALTRSWSKGATNVVPDVDAIKSNMITDYNNDLIYYDYAQETMYKWSDTPISSKAIEILTKDFDFGQPAVRKKVYKVYVSYKGDASAVTVKYGVNGETDDNDLFQFNSDNTPLEDKSSTENKESWHLAELKPTTSADANNIYSFQLKFAGTAATDFEINDISIVYRSKQVK